MKIAVDFDEVLFLLVARMIKWHKKVYNFEPNYEDFRNYRFHEAFKTPEDVASRRYIDFALSQYSAKTQPLPFAVDVLASRMKNGDALFIASSSQVEVVDAKRLRLEKHFPSFFEDFHAANHYSLLNGPVRSKADICQEIDADVMIDDNPKHLLECAHFVKTPILFGNYPWNKGEFPTLVRAADWSEVDRILNTRA